MPQSSIEEKLMRFIGEVLLEERPPNGDPLTVDAIDSLGLEQLVGFIEQEFSIRIGEEDMIIENFRSVPVLAAFIESKAECAGTEGSAPI